MLALHGARERALLAYLLLHANEVVSSDRLIDAVWGEHPPATVPSALHVYVSRLRKLLGEDGSALATRAPGYVLEVDADGLDVHRFEQLVAEGRHAATSGDAAAARRAFGEALALWRGPPLADAAGASWAADEIRRLEELHLAVLEERIEADLALGRHAEIVPELARLVARHPLRERLRGQLMVALYRSGRAADALQTYAATRRVFAEELGLEPSEALRQLEQAIIRRDPALDSPTPARPLDTPRSQRWTFRRVGIAGAALVLVAVALTLGLVLGDHGRGAAHAVSVTPDSVAVIDRASNKVVADIPLGGRPAGIAAGFGAVWVADFDDGTVLRIDAARARITRSIGVGPHPRSVAVGAGAVWVASVNRLSRIDPTYDNVTGGTVLRQRVPGFAPEGFSHIGSVAVGPAGIWVAHSISAISQIDPATAKVRRNVILDDAPLTVAVGEDEIWTTIAGSGDLISIDPATSSVTGQIHTGLPGVLSGPPAGESRSGIIFAGSSLWVAGANHVFRIDPLTRAVTAYIQTGIGAYGLAADRSAVWVTNYLGGTVSRVDPQTNKVVATVTLQNNPSDITVSRGRVWVTVN